MSDTNCPVPYTLETCQPLTCTDPCVQRNYVRTIFGSIAAFNENGAHLHHGYYHLRESPLLAFLAIGRLIVDLREQLLQKEIDITYAGRKTSLAVLAPASSPIINMPALDLTQIPHTDPKFAHPSAQFWIPALPRHELPHAIKDQPGLLITRLPPQGLPTTQGDIFIPESAQPIINSSIVLYQTYKDWFAEGLVPELIWGTPKEAVDQGADSRLKPRHGLISFASNHP